LNNLKKMARQRENNPLGLYYKEVKNYQNDGKLCGVDEIDKIQEWQALDAELMPILIPRSGHSAYSKFLDALGLHYGKSEGNYWNYEPNYLEALMNENRDILMDVERLWFRDEMNRSIWEALTDRFPTGGQ
jgi:hypothetical protein